MFLKPKKGNLVAQFVVLIVIAVILIFAVSSFGSKIWQAFFPSADKSTMKSFDAVFNVLNAKGISQKDYDSTNMNVYLRDGYRIIFFDDTNKLQCNDVHWYGPTTGTAYAPKVCKPGKQCLCLYKKMPSIKKMSSNTVEREKNLVKCYSFENKINIIDKYFDLNREVCEDRVTPYGSFMFIKRQVYPDNKAEVYVLELNDANKALDADWSIPVCKTPYDSNPCYEKRNGDTVEVIDPISLSKIYNYCKDKGAKENIPFKSLGVQCVYPPGADDCETDCAYGDVTPDCGPKYTICTDYNQLKSTVDNYRITYLNADDLPNDKHAIMCGSDAQFCDVNKGIGCKITTIDIYACKESVTGTILDYKNCLSPSDDPTLKTAGIDCKVQYLEDITTQATTSSNKHFISYYDKDNADCQKYMVDKFYDIQPMMICKADKTDDCKKFIDGKKKLIGTGYNCDLKVISDGSTYWLTHYDSSCDTEVKAIFTTASLCETV